MSNRTVATSAASPVEPDLKIAWHSLDAETLLEELHTQPQSGLSSQEAARRLAEYGPNQLAEAPRRTFF